MPKSNNKNAKHKAIYMDFAASAEPNPSSIHAVGVSAKTKLESARIGVAGFLHARGEEIIFTSGGTESNNLAIQGVVMASKLPKKSRPHIVTINIEHPSVLESVKAMTFRGMIDSTIVPVEPNGIVNPTNIKKALRDETVLVSVMYANNEIGTIQPIREIAKVIRHYKKFSGRKNIYFHTDAVQAAQYMMMDAEKLGVDMLTLSGTKVPGARGAGVLYKKKFVPLASIMYGGDQEHSLRPGTENTDAIAKLAKGLENFHKNKESESLRVTKLRNYFLKKLGKKIFAECGMVVNGDESERLPNNINVTFPQVPSDLLVLELSAHRVMTSSKSACQSSQAEGSYVIGAINPKIGKDIGGVRFTFAPGIDKSEVDHTVASLEKVLQKLKKWYY